MGPYRILLAVRHQDPGEGGRGGGGEGGESAYERGRDACRLAQGCKFWILVSQRVLWAKRHHYLAVKISFRVAREKI